MSKYNKVSSNTVVNLEGGTGVKQSNEIALISLMATGLEGRFYEMEKERETRLVTLIQAVGIKDPFLLAQIIVYTRVILGQRSITHRAAVAAAQIFSGQTWAKWFYAKWNKRDKVGGAVFRLDDITEMASCYMHYNKGKALPNSMKKGFALALQSADRYELAKYQSTGKDVSLVDVFNLVHPNARVAKAPEAFKELMAGTLKQHNTAEDKQSAAGQEVAAKVIAGTLTQTEATEELKKAKTENWKELINTKKIGYLALLRNLRNILKSDDAELNKAARTLLTDHKFIHTGGALVFPHQIDLAAMVVLDEFKSPQGRKMAVALNDAYESSVDNVFELGFTEDTAIVFDTSASMTSSGYSWGRTTMNGKETTLVPHEKSTLIAATLAKGVGADVYHFGSSCAEVSYNPVDSIFTIKDKFHKVAGQCGHGTSFGSIFSTLKRSYSRVFIISDEQGGDSILHSSSYQDYTRKYGTPYIYSIDLTGYGTTMFKQNGKLCTLAGYSAHIYETIKRYETDPNALLTEIKAIKIVPKELDSIK